MRRQPEEIGEMIAEKKWQRVGILRSETSPSGSETGSATEPGLKFGIGIPSHGS
jgi:hypothetical protein